MRSFGQQPPDPFLFDPKSPEVQPMSVLSTDDGEPLVDDDDALMETYNGNEPA